MAPFYMQSFNILHCVLPSGIRRNYDDYDYVVVFFFFAELISRYEMMIMASSPDTEVSRGKCEYVLQRLFCKDCGGNRWSINGRVVKN